MSQESENIFVVVVVLAAELGVLGFFFFVCLFFARTEMKGRLWTSRKHILKV